MVLDDLLGRESGEDGDDDVDFDLEEGGGALDDDLDALDGDDVFDDGTADGDGVFDDDDGDTRAIAELDDRLGEAENELADLSSTVNTIRQENKEIGSTVEELDEKIRKLLDIYEMVTRGINPFVDDARDMAGFENEGTFELFDTEAAPDQTDERLDSDLAEAEADEFFSDDFDELESEPEPTRAEESPDERDVAGENHGDEADDEGDAKSFDELKAEFEDGDADWTGDLGDDGDPPGEADDGDPSGEADDGGSFDEAADTHDDVPSDETDDVPSDETDDKADATFGGEADRESGADIEPERESEGEEIVETNDAMFLADAEDSETNGSGESASSPPHTSNPTTRSADSNEYQVASIPGGFLTELLLLEWLELMVERGGVGGATRALGRYERVGWLAPDARETLETYLHQLGTHHPQRQSGDGAEKLPIGFHADSIDLLKRISDAGDGPPEQVRDRVLQHRDDG